ncbi:acetylcholine receptor subunit alpha-type acr-15-like [Saccoglossus kowalevskii]
MSQILLTILVLVTLNVTCQGDRTSDVTNQLLSTYDRRFPPSADPVIYLQPHLLRVINLNNNRMSGTIEQNLFYTWNDERLVWNPEDFDGIRSFTINYNDIWTPVTDVELKYGSENRASSLVEPKASVFYEGTVYFTLHVISTVPCLPSSQEKMVQNYKCTLLYTFVNYYEQLFAEIDNYDIYDYLPNTNYHLLDTSANVTAVSYPCCPEKYYTLNMTITLTWLN